MSLHGLFDRIIIPRPPANPRVFFVFYKVVVKEPCTVSLRVIDPSRGEIQGNWRDSLSQIGPMQAIWALTSTLFKQPGHYVLELRQESEGSEALSLATMLFVVEEQGRWFSMDREILTRYDTPWVTPPDEVMAAASRLLDAAAPVDKDLSGDPSFFEGKSIEELAQSQGVGPVKNIRVFAGGIPDDEDVDEMLEEIYRLREP